MYKCEYILHDKLVGHLPNYEGILHDKLIWHLPNCEHTSPFVMYHNSMMYHRSVTSGNTVQWYVQHLPNRTQLQAGLGKSK